MRVWTRLELPLVLGLAAIASPVLSAGLQHDKLKELDAPKVSGQQKANLGLHLYRDEMVHPTPKPGPPFTEVRTHDFVLAEITRKLVHAGADTATLKKTYDSMNPGEVKDCLAIFLALKGDASVKDAVAKYVVERRNPVRLRELGCTAVGVLAVKTQDAKLGDALAQVIREDTQGIYKPVATKDGGKPTTIVFPVRKAAAEAIKKMDKAGILLPSYVTQPADHAVFEMKLPVRPAAAVKK